MKSLITICEILNARLSVFMVMESEKAHEQKNLF